MYFRIKPCLYASAIMLAGIFHINKAQGQDWQSQIKNDSDFFDIQETFEEHFIAPEGVEDGEREQFERWSYIMGPRVYFNNGKPIAPDIIYAEWKKYFSQNPQPSSHGKKNVWSYAGPKTTPTRGGGNGRINCLEFDPNNTNIIWAGTPAGGLWKSTNGGQGWTTETDNLPNLGVTDILINPRHTDTMFIATGDGFGYSIGNGNFWGGTYSMGVLMSTNGGKSWSETGLNWQRNQTRQIYKLQMHPRDPSILFATTNTGIWKSYNAGKDWTQVKGGLGYKDLLCHPTKPNLLFVSTSNTIAYSEDTGRTWKNAAVSYPKVSRAISLAIAPSADSIMYALVNYSTADGDLYRSTDYGKSWQRQPGFISITFQNWYDLALGVSPVDANRVIIGGLDILLSNNAGESWQTISDWYNWPLSYYVHADQRAIIFYPGVRDTFIAINDGGIFKTANGGQSWSNISSNIQALQFYKIGSVPSNEGVIFAGAQDNGINRGKSGVWSQVMGADGMECVVSFEDPKIVYAATQNGALAKSSNGGSSFDQYIYPTNGSWLTPVEMDPNNASTLYFGSRHLYRTTNEGDSWDDLTPNLNISAEITSLEITKDPNIIYMAHTSAGSPSAIRLRRSIDGGKTFSLITKGLPTGNNYLSDITSSPKEPGHLWITISGYAENYKVFESKDSGITWTNISSGLPNVPVNCIQAEGSLEEGVYIGTDLGVFYRNKSTNSWVFYNDELPLVMVNELEVLPQFNKIRAATYGRGVWEAPLNGTILSVEKMKSLAREILLYPNPTQEQTHIRFSEISSAPKQIRIYDVTGKLFQTIIPERQNTNEISIDTRHFPAGVYMLNLVMEDGVVTKKLNIVK